MDLTETLKSKNRVAWLDAAKLSGIFLVILGHIQIKNYGFFSPRDFIFVFHMPLFFFLSGLTQKNLSFKENLKDGVRKLLVPYVVFYFLTWLYWFPVSCLRHPELYPDVFRDGIVKPFLGFLFANGVRTRFSEMPRATWFLICLFWCKMLYSLLQSKAKNPKKINFIVSVLLLFLAYVLHYFEIPKQNVFYIDGGYKISFYERFLPFTLGSVTVCYVWFFAGTQMKERLFTNETKNISKKKRICLALLFLILTVIVYFFNDNAEVSISKYGNDVFLYLLGAVCGMIFGNL